MLFAGIAVLPGSAGADGYPPYWDDSNNAKHFDPVAWPSTWNAYTKKDISIKDQRDIDPSHGGARPQNYVNVSSGCIDQTKPSIYWRYSSTDQMLFFRWRVEQIGHTYAVGPAPGVIQNVDPWKAALWTVFLDIDADAYREFAMHLDGQTGLPKTPVDRMRSLWSDSPHHGLDYVNEEDIFEISHNPSAFVNSGGVIYSFQDALTPTTNWPNGANEVLWDYGTTRAVKIIDDPACVEYFVDYQIPLGMMNATAFGAPAFDACTPTTMFFATANSLINPFQKDLIADSPFVADYTSCAPYGDTVQLCNNKTIQQPVVLEINANTEGSVCPTTLEVIVMDYYKPSCSTTITRTVFWYYYDKNANGLDDDGETWTVAGSGTVLSTYAGKWTFSWDSSTLPKGQLLIGMEVEDNQGNITWAHLDSGALPVDGSPPYNYTNLSPQPGKIYDTFYNSCGTEVYIRKYADKTYTTPGPGSPVQFTLEIFNAKTSSIIVSNVIDYLPPGFIYNTTDGGTLQPSVTTAPTNGDIGNIVWIFDGTATIAVAASKTLIFTADASPNAGVYTNFAYTLTDASSTPVMSNLVQIEIGTPTITIRKDVDKIKAELGNTLTYTITYSNDSPISVTGATIVDDVPIGLQTINPANGGTYDSATRKITWNIGNIAAQSGDLSVTFTAVINNPYPSDANLNLINNATIDTNETGPKSDDAITLVNSPRPGIDIIKIADKMIVNPAVDNGLTYTITYRNNGNSNATSVVVTDYIPGGFLFSSATPPPDVSPGVGNGGMVSWNIGVLANGVTGTIIMVVNADAGIDTAAFPESVYKGENPAINVANITSAELPPVEDDAYTSLQGVDCAQDPSTTLTWTAGSLDLSNSTAVNSAEYTTPTGVGNMLVLMGVTNVETEVFAFWSPELKQPMDLTGDPVPYDIWMSKSGSPGIYITVYLYDYDPVADTTTLLGSTSSKLTGKLGTGQGSPPPTPALYSFAVTPNNTTIAQGHHLGFRVTTVSDHASQQTDQMFIYNSATYDAGVSFCTRTLTFDKEVDRLYVHPGETLVYTLRFANPGYGDLYNAVIVDTLPPYVSLLNANLNNTIEFVNPAVNNCTGQVCTFNVNGVGDTEWNIMVGNSGWLTMNVSVPSDLPKSVEFLTNYANITTTDTQPRFDQETVTIPLTATIEKSVSKTLLVPGDTVTYTLTVLNSGPETTNVTITDVLPVKPVGGLPEYFSYVKNSTTLGGATVTPEPYNAVSNTITVNMGTMAKGASNTVTFQMIVNTTGVPDGITTHDNFGVLTHDLSAGFTNSNIVTVTITASPLLSITKTVTPAGPVAPGNTVVWDMTIQNTGASNATNVLVQDPIPTNTQYKAGTIYYEGALQTDADDSDAGRYDGANNRVEWDVGTLNSGASRTLQFSTTINTGLSNGTTTIPNTATVTASNAASKQATASIDVVASPSFTLTKSAPQLLPYPLATITQNSYSTLTDSPAASNSFDVTDGTLFGIGNKISVGGTLANITGIAGNTLTVDVAVTGTAGVTNALNLDLQTSSGQFITGGNHIGINNSATGIVSAVNVNTVSMKNGLIANTGDSVIPLIRFVMTYVNNGTADATNVVVRDTLVAGLAFVNASNGGTESGGIVSWNIGTVKPGEGATLQFYARPTATGIYYNTGYINATELTNSPSNITNTTVGGVKTDKYTTTPLRQNTVNGTTAIYVLTLTNQLTAKNANGITVQDVLSTGFTYNSTTLINTSGAFTNRTSVSNPSVGDTSPTWGTWDLGPSGILNITFVADVANTVPAGIYQNDIIGNSTNLSVTDFDELATTKDDVEIYWLSDLAVNKSVQIYNSPCEVGCNLAYTITVTNVGNSNATGVTVTDTLPSQLNHVANIPSQGTWDPGTGIWNVGALNTSSSATLIINATVNSLTVINNCATLTNATPADTNPANNTSCVTTTRVTLTSFGAQVDGNGQVAVNWATSSEFDTAGFYLMRFDTATGKYVQINDNLLPGILTSHRGGQYSLVDTGAQAGGQYEYVLVEVETKGTKLAYGPFPVDLRAGGGQSSLINQGEVVAGMVIGGQGISALQALNPTHGAAPKLSIIKHRVGSNTLLFSNRGRGNRRYRSNWSIGPDGTLVIGNRGHSSGQASNSFANYSRKANQINPAEKARVSRRGAEAARHRALRKQRKGPALKMEVGSSALYYLDAATIAGQMGIAPSKVKNLLRANMLSLSSKGRLVPYLPAGDDSGLFFYGQELNSIYASKNVYWLTKGPGVRMRHTGTGGRNKNKGNKGASQLALTFEDTLHLEKNLFYGMGLTRDPESDYWFWEYIISGYPSMDTKTYTFDTKSVAGGSHNAQLVVRLVGATDTSANPDHHATVRLNGTVIGQTRWNGVSKHAMVLSFDQSLLIEGNNKVEVTAHRDAGVPYSYIVMDSLDLTYHRRYEAEDDSLDFTVDGGSAVTVSGFTGSDVLLLDITDPDYPLYVADAQVKAVTGYELGFTAPPSGGRFLAATLGAVKTGLAMIADQQVGLASKRNEADYLVITTDELVAEASKLAMYRETLGFKSMVVRVEDIMDEFNFGISSPHAIRDFLAYASNNWKTAPRYVLLAGEGTVDYKNYTGYNDNLVPPLMVSTPYGIYPSDNRLADFNGDSVPEMAVGRLPVVTAAELKAVTRKIMVFEDAQAALYWRYRVLLAADNPDSGGNYHKDSDELAAIFPPEYAIDKVYLSQGMTVYARNDIMDAINSGVSFMNYFGHGNMTQLANEGLIRKQDLVKMTNSGRLPFLTAMTCMVSNFAFPGFDSLSELLLLKPDGGVAAIFSSTGQSMNSEAVELDKDFYKAVFEDGHVIAGDAMLRAFERYRAGGGNKEVIDIFNLIGDPALRIR